MHRALLVASSLAAALLLATPSRADECRAEGFRTFPPPGATVPPNVEFRFFSRPSGGRLSGVVMKSSLTDLVPASVPRTELLVPRDRQVQVRRQGGGLSPSDEQVATLKPQAPVPQGTYRFGTLPVGTSYFEFLKELTWTVAGEPDATPPALDVPEVRGASCSGTKKARRCRVELSAAPAEPVVVVLELSRRGLHVTRQWPSGAGVPVVFETGACDRTARDLAAGRYDATLRFVDFAGNSSPSRAFELRLSDAPAR